MRGEPSPIRVHDEINILGDALESFVGQTEIKDFYDYRSTKGPMDLSSFKADKEVDVPPDAWPRDASRGFGSWVTAFDRIRKHILSGQATDAERETAYEGILDLLRKYPFLKYQFFYQPSGKAPPRTGPLSKVKNSCFVQFMSRWLLLLLLDARTRPEILADLPRFTEAVFPQTGNGKRAADLFRETQVLFLGVNADPDDVAGFYQDGQLDALGHFFRSFPGHLVAGGSPGDRLKSVSVHEFKYYVREIGDLGRMYYPEYASDRNYLAESSYQGGISLNTAGGPRGSPQSDVAFVSFRKGASDERQPLKRASPFLVTFGHEFLHYVHHTVSTRRSDHARRLDGLLDLGVTTRSNIRDVDQDPENLANSGKPPYRWMRDAPQESVATMANVLFVDSEAVLSWSVAVAQETRVKIQPLNQCLWLIDALSLDTEYRETDSSFLWTLQPTGSSITTIPLTLERDREGRIASVRWTRGSLRVSYDAQGWAVPEDFRLTPPSDGPSRKVLVDLRHGEALPPQYFRTWDSCGVVPVTEELRADVLKGAKLLALNATPWRVVAFSPQEREAVQQFVRDGGNLFIETLGWSVAAYGSTPASRNSLNALCRPFGIWIADDYASGEQKERGRAVPDGGEGWRFTTKSLPHPEILPHVRAIVTWGVPSAAYCQPPAFPLVECKGSRGTGALVAGSRSGKGKVVVMQPSGFFHPPFWVAPDNEGPDNARLIDDIMAWFRQEK